MAPVLLFDQPPGTHEGGAVTEDEVLTALRAIPGVVVETVAAGSDALRLHTVQPAGKRPMAGADWKRGQPRLVGTQLGV